MAMFVVEPPMGVVEKQKKRRCKDGLPAYCYYVFKTSILSRKFI
jgi:hypothetical protein